MSHSLPFSEDHRDCLQEIFNVVMGSTGEALAAYFGSFVNLTIPNIHYIQPRAISDTLQGMQSDEMISVAAQAFTADRDEGYALTIVTESSFNDLALASHNHMEDDESVKQLLKQLTEVLSAAAFSRLSEMMNVSVQADVPEVLALHTTKDQLVFDDISYWDMALGIEIGFHLENRDFNCDFVILLPDTSVDELTSTLSVLYSV